MPLLMVFIDGLGLGINDTAVNPLAVAEMPFMRSILTGPLIGDTVGRGLTNFDVVIKPTDTLLDTSGIPQSATGQTALFTGINAAKIIGRHISGFPTRFLRNIIMNSNIFKQINQAGARAVFANTFTTEYLETVKQGKWRYSVTTTAALSGGCRLLMVPSLLDHEAVYQDITNEQLQEKGYDVPIIQPEQAAVHLINQAIRNDFTLFEYFQTDRCGHHQDFDLALILLNRLDRFLGKLAELLHQYDLTLLVVSDHGNIEDLSRKTHTLNPVPTIAIGKNAMAFHEVDSLLDIYPAILNFFNQAACPTVSLTNFV